MDLKESRPPSARRFWIAGSNWFPLRFGSWGDGLNFDRLTVELGPLRLIVVPVAIALMVIASLKLSFLMIDSPSLMGGIDPVFGISNRTLIMVVGPLEAILGALWFSPRSRVFALLGTLILSIGFLLHYIVSGSLSAGYVCPCLGAIFQLLPALKILQRFIILTIIVWLLSNCMILIFTCAVQSGNSLVTFSEEE